MAPRRPCDKRSRCRIGKRRRWGNPPPFLLFVCIGSIGLLPTTSTDEALLRDQLVATIFPQQTHFETASPVAERPLDKPVHRSSPHGFPCRGGRREGRSLDNGPPSSFLAVCSSAVCSIGGLGAAVGREPGSRFRHLRQRSLRLWVPPWFCAVPFGGYDVRTFLGAGEKCRRQAAHLVFECASCRPNRLYRLLPMISADPWLRAAPMMMQRIGRAAVRFVLQFHWTATI